MSHRNPDGSPNLWDDDEELPPLVSPAPGGTIQQRFERFHRLNPWVYDALVFYARDFLSGGRSRVGMKMLFERVRWERNRRTTGETFKLSNDFHARYARLVMAQEPDLAGKFETRELRERGT